MYHQVCSLSAGAVHTAQGQSCGTCSLQSTDALQCGAFVVSCIPGVVKLVLMRLSVCAFAVCAVALPLWPAAFHTPTHSVWLEPGFETGFENVLRWFESDLEGVVGAGTSGLLQRTLHSAMWGCASHQCSPP